jgi:hypothetical protein
MTKTSKLIPVALTGLAIGTFGGVGLGLGFYAISSNYPGVVEIEITLTSIKVHIDGQASLKFLPGASDLGRPRFDTDKMVPKEDPLRGEVSSRC